MAPRNICSVPCVAPVVDHPALVAQTGPVGRHLHLDPLGGIAGDMFAAAMLDAWPALGEGLREALHRAGLLEDVQVRWERVTDEVLAGTAFRVDDPRERGRTLPASNLVLARGAASHAHVPFRDVRARIAAASLPDGVKERAQDIFLHLATAEAAVHGLEHVDDVELHEVGAQDAIADVVSAAWLLHHADVESASTSPVPLGSGRVESAHGLLPLPAPAALRLLDGIATFDDGRKGERVTPTGAAILKHLAPGASRPAGVVGASGVGWGTKRFAGLPNVLRVFAIEGGDRPAGLHRESIATLAFEVDDQSPEDLAVALDHLRAQDDVLDVTQAPVFGKKGRLGAAVRVLVRAGAEDAAARTALLETTTLGVRVAPAERLLLAREAGERHGVRVKRAQRPDGIVTAKAEMDDLASTRTAAARARRRRDVEET